MEYRQLGNSGLRVSVLAMGTMTFGGRGNFAKVGNLGLDDVRRLIAIVADAGVNLIDTANVYSGGASEELIGEAMGKRKGAMLIATKARFPMGEGPNDRGLSRWHLIRECEASLKRLRTDVIDLYQVHQWDGLTPLEETMEALDSLVRSGKVRYVGCSNWSGWHVMKAMEVARRDHRIPFVSEQIHYTLQAREAEYELIPVAVDQKLGVLVWSPLAGGLLTDKFATGTGPEDARRAKFDFPPVDKERALRCIGRQHKRQRHQGPGPTERDRDLVRTRFLRQEDGLRADADPEHGRSSQPHASLRDAREGRIQRAHNRRPRARPRTV